MGTENIIFFSIPTLHFDVHRFFILLITFILVFLWGLFFYQIFLREFFPFIVLIYFFEYILERFFFISLYLIVLFHSAGFSECSFSVFFFISIIVLFLLILSRHIFKSYHLIFLFIFLPVLCLSCV